MAALASGAQLLAFPRPAGMGFRASLMAHLKRHRLPDRLIEAFIHEAALLPVCGIDQALSEVLAARMRAAPLDLSRSGSRIFLIGPCGAGVRTVAAKLRRQAERTGASILVESQSFHPRNIRARTAFRCLADRPGVAMVGVVSALADAEEISEIISAFRLNRVIVTGLDMARRFGALAAAATQGARLAHVTRSPDPEMPLEILSPSELAGMLLS